jgi:hypothetical protein
MRSLRDMTAATAAKYIGCVSSRWRLPLSVASAREAPDRRSLLAGTRAPRTRRSPATRPEHRAPVRVGRARARRQRRSERLEAELAPAARSPSASPGSSRGGGRGGARPSRRPRAGARARSRLAVSRCWLRPMIRATPCCPGRDVRPAATQTAPPPGRRAERGRRPPRWPSPRATISASQRARSSTESGAGWTKRGHRRASGRRARASSRSPGDRSRSADALASCHLRGARKPM